MKQPDKKSGNWMEYFKELLSGEVSKNSIPRWDEQSAEPEVCEINLEKTKMAINSLKNWKAPGTDGIPAELLKYGGEVMHKHIHEVCMTTLKEEKSFRRIGTKLLSSHYLRKDTN